TETLRPSIFVAMPRSFMKILPTGYTNSFNCCRPPVIVKIQYTSLQLWHGNSVFRPRGNTSKVFPNPRSAVHASNRYKTARPPRIRYRGGTRFAYSGIGGKRPGIGSNNSAYFAVRVAKHGVLFGRSGRPEIKDPHG